MAARAVQEIARLVSLPRSGIRKWLNAPAAASRVRWCVVADQLRSKIPPLAAMDGTQHEVLTFLDFPKQHRVRSHSEPLERLNGGITRQANVVGIFPNEAATRRLIGALWTKRCDEYAI